MSPSQHGAPLSIRVRQSAQNGFNTDKLEALLPYVGLFSFMGNNRSKQNNDILSTLTLATNAVNLAKTVVSAQPAHAILSAASGILSIIKGTIKNKEDFRDLIRQCEWVGKLIESNPIVGHDQMNPALLEAMIALSGTISATRNRVAWLGERQFFLRIFTSSLDVKSIRDMTSQLDRNLENLKTALHLSNTMTLQAHTRAIKSVVQVLGPRNEIPRHTSFLAPPPRPAIFCGRDHLVSLVSDKLLSAPGSERRHVALLGVGGIGKSSIAKAVLNEPHIEERFAGRRFFVRFDDILSSRISYATFIDRIAYTLGITSGIDHSSILEDIKNKMTLLVLDNGETFLDPEASHDISRIKMTIDELGGFPSVSLLLTSRSKELPRGLMWEKIEVPSLDPAPAFDVFTRIFRGDVSSSRTTLEAILAATDHHPLTITLLASAAETNTWSINDLNERWTARPTKLLNSGHGKYESLADSIEISLNSPCVSVFGENVRRVLGMIAFLPQGIPRKNLQVMFPSIGQVTEIVEVLHKQSLIVFIDSFASMLAPIRLYAKDVVPNPDTLLLNDIRRQYHRLIHASVIIDKESLITQDENVKSLILSEDINLEALITFDLQGLSNDTDAMRALQACEAFIHCIRFYRPRSTSLRTALQSIVIPHSPAVSAAHFVCFKALAALAHARYDVPESLKSYAMVRDIAAANGRHDEAIRATLFIASFHLDLGACSIAKKILEHAYRMPGWSTTTALNKALADGLLGSLGELTDAPITGAALANIHRAARELFQVSGALTTLEACRIFRAFAPALVNGGNHELEFVRVRLREMNVDHERRTRVESHALSMLLVIAAFVNQDIKEAERLLKHAWVLSIETKFSSHAAQVLVWLALIAVIEGNAGIAKELVKRAKEQQKDDRIFSENNWCWCYFLYVSGVVELVSGHLCRALEIFEETKRYCETRGEFRIRAMSSRAMGEVAHLQGYPIQAQTFFEETASICADAGIVPRFLCRTYIIPVPMLANVPPATYEAWPAFLKTKSGSGNDWSVHV